LHNASHFFTTLIGFFPGFCTRSWYPTNVERCLFEEENQKMQRGKIMARGYCPDCDESISLRNPKVGQVLLCPHCDTEVEVVGLDPLELDWAYASADDDDWDDEDE
jgi:lysine biosynthesis protein LysW